MSGKLGIQCLERGQGEISLWLSGGPPFSPKSGNIINMIQRLQFVSNLGSKMSCNFSGFGRNQPYSAERNQLQRS